MTDPSGCLLSYSLCKPNLSDILPDILDLQPRREYWVPVGEDSLDSGHMKKLCGNNGDNWQLI